MYIYLILKYHYSAFVNVGGHVIGHSQTLIRPVLSHYRHCVSARFIPES